MFRKAIPALRLLSAGSLALGLLWPAAAAAQHAGRLNSEAEERECGSLLPETAYEVPPHDYRATDPGTRAMLAGVTSVHLPPDVEALRKLHVGSFGGSASYTLLAFPNHVRALSMLIRLGEREKSEQPVGAKFTIDCFFRRALRFVPDDLVVRMLYVTYLQKKGRIDAAMTQLAAVDEMAGDSPMTRRNLGLLYLGLKRADLAAAQLSKADSTDAAMVDLRNKLVAAGIAVPPNVPPAMPASSASR